MPIWATFLAVKNMHYDKNCFSQYTNENALKSGNQESQNWKRPQTTNYTYLKSEYTN